MLRKLLITSLLFTALFTVSCEKLKEWAGGITGSDTGIDKTYVGTWNSGSEFGSIFFGSRIIIYENGGMGYQDAGGKKELIFGPGDIFNLNVTYRATYTENNPNDPSITDTFTVVIKFNSESQASVNYSKTVANNTTSGENGIFNKQ